MPKPAPTEIDSVIVEALEANGTPPAQNSKIKPKRKLKEPSSSTQPAQAKQAPTRYTASIYSEHPLPPMFVSAVQSLEQMISKKILIMMQGDQSSAGLIEDSVADRLLAMRQTLPENVKLAVLLDSPGGSAKAAYQMAMTLRNHCGGFDVLIPRYAKSAATLFSLGADTIFLDRYAEIGPLDAQYLDTEREHRVSALDEVQSLERLHAFALEAVDRSMLFLCKRSGKKIETLLPKILDFVTNMMRPLIEKIDTVHYTQISRGLKVAEEYATRLLQQNYSKDDAQSIARHLVENYPEHGFFIDSTEAASFGLKTIDFPNDQKNFIEVIRHLAPQISAFGTLKPISGAP